MARTSLMTWIFLSPALISTTSNSCFSTTASAPADPAAAGAAGAEAAAEKDEFDVVLIGVGDKKIQVIKEVRAITSLGLKEAKELVESAPQAIKEGSAKVEAQKIKEKIEGAGGQVDIK